MAATGRALRTGTLGCRNEEQVVRELGGLIDANHTGGHQAGGSGKDIYDFILDYPE